MKVIFNLKGLDMEDQEINTDYIIAATSDATLLAGISHRNLDNVMEGTMNMVTKLLEGIENATDRDYAREEMMNLVLNVCHYMGYEMTDYKLIDVKMLKEGK